MDSGDAIQLIVLLLLVLLSAFFSSAETAMTTVNKIRIMSLADEGNKSAKTSSICRLLPWQPPGPHGFSAMRSSVLLPVS